MTRKTMNAVAMWLLRISLISQLSVVFTACPCSDRNLCRPISSPPRKEIVVFQRRGTYWKDYDWSVVTTVAMFGKYDPELMCYAHSKGARVVLPGILSAAQVKNETFTKLWIAEQVQLAHDQYMDGINIDVEDALDRHHAYFLTQLVADIAKAFYAAIPGSQVSTDVMYSPDCINECCYDYRGIAEVCDFLILMSYDEQSQVYGDCIAMANSPYNKTIKGVEEYHEKLGISAGKLVLGVPWYGYDYKCLHLTEDGVCSIEKVPFRGAPCSDAAGQQIEYRYLQKMLTVNSTTGRLWNSTDAAPYFQYKSTTTGATHQVWYDDPQSLKYRYDYASSHLRGIGVWHGDCLDYYGDSKGRQQTKDMWDTLRSSL